MHDTARSTFPIPVALRATPHVSASEGELGATVG